jgi:hypothetical protein
MDHHKRLLKEKAEKENVVTQPPPVTPKAAPPPQQPRPPVSTAKPTKDDIPPPSDENDDYDGPIVQRGSRTTARPKRLRRNLSKSTKSKVSVKRKRQADDAIDDDVMLTHGKQLLGIPSLDKAYPHLRKKSKRVITQGVKRMIDGNFDGQLSEKEKQLIAENRKKFQKVVNKKKNPFEKKRKIVGDIYSRFIKEAYLEEATSSDSTSDTDSTSSDE